jgi:hypothetical protein
VSLTSTWAPISVRQPRGFTRTRLLLSRLQEREGRHNLLLEASLQRRCFLSLSNALQGPILTILIQDPRYDSHEHLPSTTHQLRLILYHIFRLQRQLWSCALHFENQREHEKIKPFRRKYTRSKCGLLKRKKKYSADPMNRPSRSFRPIYWPSAFTTIDCSRILLCQAGICYLPIRLPQAHISHFSVVPVLSSRLFSTIPASSLKLRAAPFDCTPAG